MNTRFVYVFNSGRRAPIDVERGAGLAALGPRRRWPRPPAAWPSGRRRAGLGLGGRARGRPARPRAGRASLIVAASERASGRPNSNHFSVGQNVNYNSRLFPLLSIKGANQLCFQTSELLRSMRRPGKQKGFASQPLDWSGEEPGSGRAALGSRLSA